MSCYRCANWMTLLIRRSLKAAAIATPSRGEEPAGGQSGNVRHPVPPPGPRLEFDRWCRVLTAELRRYLPDVRASTNRRCDRVTWRHRELLVTCTNDRGVFSIRTDPRFGGFHDAERHDVFTATTLAKSIAGHFDAAFSVADR